MMIESNPIPPPAGSPARTLHPNIPPTLTSFVGREAEIAELARLLSSEDVRVVTVTGAGGIGKTRLVQEIVPVVQSGYAHGSGYVQLASLQDRSLLPITIARELNIPITDDASAEDRLRHVLHDMHALVIVDNAEHLIDEVARVLSMLLRSCPDLTALVTSREPLGVYGEWVYPLQPLEAGIGKSAQETSGETAPAAVQLFADRASALDRHFALTSENMPIIAGICAHLDGIPLAIELAASRLNLLSPAALFERLQRRLPLLTGTFRDSTPERSQCMRETIAWSYDLLPAEEQRLFWRLAVFSGGFDIESAEAIAIDESAPGSSSPASGKVSQFFEVFEGVGSLVAKSLLRSDMSIAIDRTRYSMFETIREYGLEQLAASGEEAALRNRHAAYFAGWAERCWAEAGDLPSLRHWLGLLEENLDNVRAALDWLTKTDPAAALAMAGALHWFWNVRGHIAEGLKRLETLDALAAEPVSDEVRARALMVTGNLAHLQRDGERAATLLDEAMALWRRADHSWGIGTTHMTIGMMAKDRGEFERAEQEFRAALPLLEAAGDTAAARTVLGNLAAVAFGLDNFEAVDRWQEQIEPRKDELETRSGGWTMHLRGLVAVAKEELDQAAELFAECLQAFIAYGYPIGVLESVAGAAATATESGNFEHAARLFGIVDAMCHELDYQFLHPGKAIYERALGRLRDELGPQRLDDLMGTGHQLPRENLAELVAPAAVLSPPSDAGQRDAASHAAERLGLTGREVEVLRYAALGLSDAEIAGRLFISHRTVSRHLLSAYRKLGVRTRSAAGARAAALGIIEPSRNR
jgi:non-specific serine/threonine protein kinase